jgi:hypothetical protein
MPKICGADAGRDGGSIGNPVTFMVRLGRSGSPFRLLILIALGVLAQGLLVPGARSQVDVRDKADPAPAPSQPPQKPARLFEVMTGASTDRDSLMIEIQQYTEMIRGLRDSLTSDQKGLQLSPDQREKLEGSIKDISQVIERISQEMSRMEFEIKDNRISLVNEAGEGIVINVPEDLDAQVSEGIEAITKVILSELPDSIDFDHSKKWDWNRFQPKAPPPARRIINGNIVKVWDDVQISAKEDVRGNVVVIFGDAEVSGRVDGSVVTVFGNLLLAETAEVTGTVVAAGGYLDQDPGAQVEDVVAVDPLRQGQGDGWLSFFTHDGMSFLIFEGTFLLTVLLAVVAVAATPRRRFDRITAYLRGAPMPSLGVGVLAAMGGHLLVAVLMAVLILTVIGLPLALLVGMLLLVVVVVSVAVCGAVVGERLCALFGGRCHSPWLVVVVGMTALHLVSFLGSLLGLTGGSEMLASGLIILGATIKILAYLLGLGALALSRFGSRPAAI